MRYLNKSSKQGITDLLKTLEEGSSAMEKWSSSADRSTRSVLFVAIGKNGKVGTQLGY